MIKLLWVKLRVVNCWLSIFFSEHCKAIIFIKREPNSTLSKPSSHNHVLFFHLCEISSKLRVELIDVPQSKCVHVKLIYKVTSWICVPITVNKLVATFIVSQVGHTRLYVCLSLYKSYLLWITISLVVWSLFDS